MLQLDSRHSEAVLGLVRGLHGCLGTAGKVAQEGGAREQEEALLHNAPATDGRAYVLLLTRYVAV